MQDKITNPLRNVKMVHFYIGELQINRPHYKEYWINIDATYHVGIDTPVFIKLTYQTLEKLEVWVDTI